MVDLIIKLISKLFGFDMKTGTLVALATVALALGAAYKGYRYGVEVTEGECAKDKLKQAQTTQEAVNAAVATANKEAEEHQRLAADAIKELQIEKDNLNERIKQLLKYKPATCDGRIIIDDEWLRHFNEALTRSGGSRSKDGVSR